MVRAYAAGGALPYPRGWPTASGWSTIVHHTFATLRARDQVARMSLESKTPFTLGVVATRKSTLWGPLKPMNGLDLEIWPHRAPALRLPIVEINRRVWKPGIGAHHTIEHIIYAEWRIQLDPARARGSNRHHTTDSQKVVDPISRSRQPRISFNSKLLRVPRMHPRLVPNVDFTIKVGKHLSNTSIDLLF